MPAGGLFSVVAAPWRLVTASGAVVGAMALGLRWELGRGPGAEAVVVDAAGARPDPGAFLDLHFDARGPDDTWAVVRPWLRARYPT